MGAFQIATLTVNPAIDVSAPVGQVVPDRKLRCETPCHEPGGGGLNVSRAIRTLGGETLAIYTSSGSHLCVSSLLEGRRRAGAQFFGAV